MRSDLVRVYGFSFSDGSASCAENKVCVRGGLVQWGRGHGWSRY